MESLKLDDSGDLVMENGELQIIGGLDEIIQCYRSLMRTNLGEWFLNPFIGFDFSVVNGAKDIDIEKLQEALQDVAEQFDEIDRVEDVNYNFNRKSRETEISYTVITIDGLTFNIKEVF